MAFTVRNQPKATATRRRNNLAKYSTHADTYSWDDIPETERAWAAGFFDGEGSATYIKARRKLEVSAKQVDRRPLDRFVKAVGWGKVYGPYDSGGNANPYNSKPCHRWQLNGEVPICDFLTKIGPYLSEPKFEQITKVLTDFNIDNGGV